MSSYGIALRSPFCAGTLREVNLPEAYVFFVSSISSIVQLGFVDSIAFLCFKMVFCVQTKDAFTALLDDLAKRPLETPELDCFDPRLRFQTKRCISGKQNVANEAT